MARSSALEELITEVRRLRDVELADDTTPLMPLSEAKRRQRRAGPLVFLLMAAWVGSFFFLGFVLKPWIATDWLTPVVCVYCILSLGPFFYGWVLIHRWFGLRCPHCRSTYIWIEPIGEGKRFTTEEDDRRCSRCQAVIFDLSA